MRLIFLNYKERKRCKDAFVLLRVFVSLWFNNLAKRVVVSFCLLINCPALFAQTNTKYALIPYPVSLQETNGKFIINASTKIFAAAVFNNETIFLQTLLQQLTGKQLKTAQSKSASGTIIILKQDKTINAEEGYRISITPQKIILSAQFPAGIFRAVQTLRQLLPVRVEGSSTTQTTATIPGMQIHDEPAFAWRGMHLDVARHFFSVTYLKKFMDLMALYKMNKFHLHLTDDQGWRIEIKPYPKLTDEGAWRSFNKQDSFCMKAAMTNPDMAIDTAHIRYRNGKPVYGGFYTQQQVKELVAYAASKHIELIPEIDMPGHMMAAINAYPFLSCDGGSEMGRLFSTPICPCSETTFEFAENVFSEIMELFPSPYIHLGADEVEKTTWAASSSCKALMEKEGLKNVAELQSYFVHRMEKFFHSKGKKLIGWDEILEGGISKSAVVMYWRSYVSTDIPVKAARNGNQVIMTPGNPLYFDNPEDLHSLKNIYAFDVLPPALYGKESKLIIGAQANIWTEEVPSEARADFLLMPRMTALAERLWNNRPGYASYRERLKPQFRRLDALKVRYRIPDLPGMIDENVFTDSVALTIDRPMEGLNIRYTNDGTVPDERSAILLQSLPIKKETTVKLAAYSATGLRGDVYTLHYTKQNYANPAVSTTAANGLACSYYKKFFRTTAVMAKSAPDSAFISKNFVVPPSVKAPSFGLQYKGYVDVPAKGIYTFYLTCDDGGVLRVAGREVVNNDGLHSAIQKSGQVALHKGLHKIELDFIEGGGGYKLELKYSKEGGPIEDIPSSWLKQ